MESVQPYVVGKVIRQNKTKKKLLKAVDIANRIIAKEVTFKDASKIWMKKARVRGNSRLPKSKEVARLGSESKHTEVSLKKDRSVSPLSPKKTQAQTKIIKNSSNQKSSDSNFQDKSRRKGSAGGGTTNKTSRKVSIEQSTQVLPRFQEKHRRNVFEKQNSTEKMWNEVMKEPASDAKLMNEETYSTPAFHKLADNKSKMRKKSLRSSDQKNIDHKKDEILDVIHDTPQKIEPQRATVKPAHQGKNLLQKEQLLTDQKTSKKPENSHKTRQVAGSVNNITLSILEETPKDMTPIKSPRINKPFSPRPVNPDNQKSQKKVDATANKHAFSSAKKLSINQQKTGKSTLRKSSIGKNGKRSVANDGDNSSYNTEEMEGMMQNMDIHKVNSNVQLRDIIPLRDSGRSINTISESSTPASKYQGSPKKEFMLEDDRSPEQAISEPSDDCLSLLSSEQRRHIAQSDMELDRSMEQFQEAGRLIRLHGKIPKGSLSLEQIVADFLKVYQKAEVHRLPPEILLSNNIGASLNTINQTVKSIIDYIPQEHHPILTLLDECCTMLKNMLEDYYFKSDDLFAKYNINIKPEQKQLSKRPPELKTSQLKTSAFKSEIDQTHKLDKKPELTSTLLPNSIQLTPQQSKTQRLDITGPFNLFARPSQKTPDQSSQVLEEQNSICVTPGLIKKDQTKKENADTALSMNGTTLKDSRTDKIRGLIRYIDFVLAQVTSSPTKKRNNIDLVSEEEGQYDRLSIAKMPRIRLQACQSLFKPICAKLINHVKARQITHALEDHIHKMYSESNQEYLAAMKALGRELGKPHVKEADILKISQAKPEDLEVFVSTLCNPKYFEL